MGVFLQNALFPGCDESAARAAVEAAAGNPGFRIAPENCRYAQSHEGTQVLIRGDAPGFAPLARALSDASENPVMLLYIFDGDYWGYDFCVGKEEDHFSTLPDYFRPVSPGEKQRLGGGNGVYEAASGLERSAAAHRVGSDQPQPVSGGDGKMGCPGADLGEAGRTAP